MTVRTSNVTNLLYYNPAGPGFDAVASATIFCPDSMNEGDTITVDVVTWGIPDGTTLLHLFPLYGKDLTAGRFNVSQGFTVQNNRASFTVTVNADNITASAGQSFDIIIKKTLTGPVLAIKSGIVVNDTSQDPQILVMDLDPANYVPANSSTITVTVTYTNGGAGFPDGSGGSYFRYQGSIPTQPSVNDTFVLGGTTRTIKQVLGAELYPTNPELYFIGFAPGVTDGSIPVGTQIDITHGSDGLSISDASGQNNPGRLVNGVGYGGSGSGSYFILDGTNDYINVPSLQNSSFKSVTMSLWFNSSTGVGSLITKELAYKMRLGSNQLSVLASDNGTSWPYNTSNNTPIANNGWNHVAVTISSSTINFYLNGVEILTSAGIGNLVANTQPLMIGSYGAGASEFFTGKIGVARLYTYALSLSDIESYVMSTAPRYGYLAARHSAYSNGPNNSMIFNTVFAQDVTGWQINGYQLGGGITVTSQSSSGSQTFITLSQSIIYFATVYTFTPL